MWLFAVLDVILEKPMKDALDMVQVSDDIRSALIDGEGKLAPVLDFVKEYEIAGWQEVSRLMILENIDMDTVYDDYLDTLKWYRDLTAE